MIETKASESVRVRFAPSPTGELHLGGARTALFNYLFARRHQGTYLVRVEDTDRERSTQSAVDTIFKSLEWLGLQADEEPQFQSERLSIYQRYALELLTSGDAYPCYATQEELTEMREQARAEKRKRVYDGRYRPAEKEPLEASLPTGSEEKPFVLRIRAPQEGVSHYADLIVGGVSTPYEEIEDFIIMRSDGTPTYNFTVVVDDHDMRISHVIRGMDHISNTPKQLVIYQALGLTPPAFAHVPMILGEDKKKLSKRHGATAVFDYKSQGYLPEAFLNYLARLGWSHGDQELFSLSELEEVFDLSHVNKSDAVFDFDKFLWVNAEHIKRTPAETLAAQLRPFLEEIGLPSLEKAETAEFVALVSHLVERSKTLREMAESCEWFFHDAHTLHYDEKASRKHLAAKIRKPFSELLEKFEKLEKFTEQNTEAVVQEIVHAHELKLGKLAQPIRVAITGTAVSPTVFAVLEILGKTESLARLKQALEFIPGD